MTERETLAAEHALGLLEGQELMDARRLEAEYPEFAAEVSAWQERLAPLFDEIESVAPVPALWERIQRVIGTVGTGAEVLQMRRKVRRWRSMAALAAAAAAAFALLALPPLIKRPAAPPQASTPSPMLIASLGDAQAPGAVAVTFVPAAGELLITASALGRASGHDHELWIIPAGGTPISLGVLPAAASARRRVSPELFGHFQSGATMALTREQAGGSPTGRPIGPVVAEGNLQAV